MGGLSITVSNGNFTGSKLFSVQRFFMTALGKLGKDRLLRGLPNAPRAALFFLPPTILSFSLSILSKYPMNQQLNLKMSPPPLLGKCAFSRNKIETRKSESGVIINMVLFFGRRAFCHHPIEVFEKNPQPKNPSTFATFALRFEDHHFPDGS